MRMTDCEVTDFLIEEESFSLSTGFFFWLFVLEPISN